MNKQPEVIKQQPNETNEQFHARFEAALAQDAQKERPTGNTRRQKAGSYLRTRARFFKGDKS